MNRTKKVEVAIFGAGCFWGVEAEFRKIPGVNNVLVGYAGGHIKNPSYQEVCTGTTGHAEVVKVFYDQKKVAYTELLDAFWNMHNPTQYHKQGPDIGEQYRSVIFYTTEVQRKEAEISREVFNTSGKYIDDVVTEITPLLKFYRAEEYHQRYLEKKGQLVCH